MLDTGASMLIVTRDETNTMSTGYPNPPPADFRSVATLTRDWCLSERQVVRKRLRWVAEGRLKLVPRFRPNGSQTSSQMIWLDPELRRQYGLGARWGRRPGGVRKFIAPSPERRPITPACPRTSPPYGYKNPSTKGNGSSTPQIVARYARAHYKRFGRYPKHSWRSVVGRKVKHLRASGVPPAEIERVCRHLARTGGAPDLLGDLVRRPKPPTVPSVRLSDAPAEVRTAWAELKRALATGADTDTVVGSRHGNEGDRSAQALR